jgi:tetratricopeptide (TPR) repeat protein
LERIEKSFQQFPPYWYYRGQAAQEIGNIQEALRCFNQFQQFHQGIFRKDPYAASTAMHKSMLMEGQATPDQLRSDLKIIVDNSDDADWGNILFAALQYARISDADKASQLILRNLDNGHTAFIENSEMVRTVGPALLLNARPDVFNRIMDTVMKNDKIKNYDVLWLYGQIRNRDILNRIQPEFDRVLLVTANKSLLNPLNLFKGDNITMFLPTRWIADNLMIRLRLNSENETREVQPSEVGPLPNFPEITVLTFSNVLSVKTSIKKKRSAQIAIDLVLEKLAEDKTDREAYAIEMVFTTTIVTSGEKLAKERYYADSLAASGTHGGKAKIFAVDKSADQPTPSKDEATKKEKGTGDLALWLAKEKIVVNGETFGWSDHGIIFQ